MDKYTLVKQLGRGNFGVVSVVRRRSDQRLCVLKEIDLTQLDEDVKRAALGEAQLLSSLNHPCIVGYIESFLTDAPPLDDTRPEEEGGGGGGGGGAASKAKRAPLPGQARDTLCIVMEYCAGGDVGEMIRRMKSSEMRAPATAAAQQQQAPFAEDQILDWFVQLALALKYIHSHHILHRDLKAQNVFLTSDSRVKLGDFGISKVLNSEADFARTVIGTPYYLSPEICEGKAYAKKSDVWSLGLFLYELCTLRHAFDGATLPALVMKILRGSYPPIPAVYSDHLRALIAMMLSLDPTKRPSITQILRLEFVRQRMDALAKKHPEMRECWAKSMKLHSEKELYVTTGTTVQQQQQQQQGARAPTSAPPPSSAGPASSPSSSRRKPAVPTAASASHKPVSQRRVAPSSAVASTRTKARMPAASSSASSSHHSSLRARPSTPPPPSSSSSASATAAATAPVLAPPPTLDDDDLDEDDDDDDDCDEEDEPHAAHAPASGSGGASRVRRSMGQGGGPGSPLREPLIKTSWFDAAAQEYEALMAFNSNSNGGGESGSNAAAPEVAASDSAGGFTTPPHTPRRKPAVKGAASGASAAAAAGTKAVPASAAPLTRRRPSASVASAPMSNPHAAANAPNRRRSDGPSSLAGGGPASRLLATPARGGTRQPQSSPSHHPHMPLSSPSSASSAAAAASAADGDECSPLQKMMAEIEEQKRRTRQWKRDRAQARLEKKAAEADRIAKHKAAIKAIKSRSSMAPMPAASPSSAAHDEEDEAASSHDSAASVVPLARAHSDPNHSSNSNNSNNHLLSVPPASAAPGSSSENKRGSSASGSAGKGKGGSSAPSSSRSPSASASGDKKAPSMAPGTAARRRTVAHTPSAHVAALSPSPRSRSPGAPSSSPAAAARAPVERPSVRDFIAAKKKEAAAAAAASGGGAFSPTVEVLATRPDQPASLVLVPATAPGASASSSSSSSESSGGVAVALAPSSSPASKRPGLRASLAGGGGAKNKREIQFELVLQSSAQAAQVAASMPTEEQLAATAARPLAPASSTPALHPSPAAAAAASTAAPVSSAPQTRSRAASDSVSRNTRSAQPQPFASPSAPSPLAPSPQDFAVQYAAYPSAGAADSPPAAANVPASASASSSASASAAASSAAQLVRDMLSRNEAQPQPPLHPNTAGMRVSLVPMGSTPAGSSPDSGTSAAAVPSPRSSSATPARAVQLSYQISEGRMLCCSMLGEATFDRCYSYLRENNQRRKARRLAAAAAAATGDPTPVLDSSPIPDEAEQERVVKSWLTPQQFTAYGHIQSLLFCEDLLSKM